jgi:hypothetical protein
MSDDFISFEDAAKYLDVDIFTLTRFVKNGGLPIFRGESGTRQISRADLAALVERCRVQPGTVGTPVPASRARHPSGHPDRAHHGNGKAPSTPPYLDLDRGPDKTAE